MSVFITENFTPVLFMPPPPLDSPLPIGVWRSGRILTGDASGGYVAVTFAPYSAAEAAKYLWSIEGAAARYGAVLGASIRCMISAIMGEPYTPGGGAINPLEMVCAFEMPVTVNIGTRPLFSSDWPGHMKYIHQPGGGLTNSYGVYVDLNTNGVPYIFFAWGYVWNPQARRLGGGPRRP